MKPLIVYINNDKDEITLTKKQFEDYLDQAYNQGYIDNRNYYTNIPSITWNTNPPNKTWYDFTCTDSASNCETSAINKKEE